MRFYTVVCLELCFILLYFFFNILGLAQYEYSLLLLRLISVMYLMLTDRQDNGGAGDRSQPAHRGVGCHSGVWEPADPFVRAWLHWHA